MTRFSEQLSGLVGKMVRLGRGGPGEKQGHLLGAKEDYLTLLAEDSTLIHYPHHHLKSVTELLNKGADQNATLSVDPDLMETLPPTFWELMKSLHGKKIKVYDHGPEAAAGFLFDCGEDYVQLVTGPDELVHYPFFHIRSVFIPQTKNENKEENKDDNKEQRAERRETSSSSSNNSSRRDSSGSGRREMEDRRWDVEERLRSIEERISESEEKRDRVYVSGSGETRRVKWVTGTGESVYYPTTVDDDRVVADSKAKRKARKQT